MKKIISILLIAVTVLTLVLSLTGCGGTVGKKVASIDDLPGSTIGVQLGTTGDIYASDYEKEGSTISRFNKGSDAIIALIQGKVDCVIIDTEPAKEFVKENEGLKILEEPFVEEEYAICIAKGNDQLTEDMNEALSELKADGTLQQIVDNFIDDEKKGKCPYKTPAGTEYPNGTLHMATNATFPPYEYMEGVDIVGIDPMIARAICDKLGYKLVIDNMEFKAIITAVTTGKSDFGMAGMTVTEDRLKEINFTDTYAEATQVIIVNESAGGIGLFDDVSDSFHKTFIKDDNWKLWVKGFNNTLVITLLSAVIGIVIGFIIAMVRSSHDLNLQGRKCRTFSDYILKFLNFICNIYITVIRGTPVIIQLMIIFYVIFASERNGLIPAVIAFSINSGAYVAEIVRSGIMSIDKGQFEASRSLGFDYKNTMMRVILPQAIKNVLPTLGNEMIVLLKETSVAGYVTIIDLTQAGDLIRSGTYEAFFPLITVAVIYLVIVMFMSFVLKILERRLRNSDH